MNIKRILSILLCICMLSVFAVLPAGAGETDDIADTGYTLLTEEQFNKKIATVSAKYPHGGKWSGTYYEDGMAKAWTCHGYAVQMFYEFFGAKYYAERLFDYKYYDVSGVCAGDIVRIGWDSHSIFVTKVTSEGIYFTDANYDGANTIEWNAFISKSQLSNSNSYYGLCYRYHIPGNTLVGEDPVYTISYNANGGSGSIASEEVKANGKFKLRTSGFSRSGYVFAGYIVRRSYDNTWYTTDAKWQARGDIYDNDYTYKVYPKDRVDPYTLSEHWIGGVVGSCEFTFYAEWIPEKATVEFMENYSGYNYMLGSDLGSDYSKYLKSRDSSVYTVSVDKSERMNNQSSLKIVGSSAGSSDSDLAFITSTNSGYGGGISQQCIAGDEGCYCLRFCAKASVDGAKMYIRWGYSSVYEEVKLKKSWDTYYVFISKNRFYGSALHPYFDKKGTYYINSLALCEVSTTNVVPERGRYAASSRTVRIGEPISDLPVPTRPGYTFLGWYTAAEDGDIVTESTPITAASIRLYAHWSKDVSYEPVKSLTSNGHVYELYDNAMSWEDADIFCKEKGGHLITIDSFFENNLAYDMICDRQGYCWIGFYYDYGKGSWQWTNGETPTFIRWFDDEYGALDTGEYFAMMYPMDYGTKSYAGLWDKCVGSEYYSSYYGYYNSFFICEYDDLLGDADGSRTVDITDAAVIQRSVTELSYSAYESTVMRGDVDGSGSLEITDATFVQRFCSLIATPYKIGELIG